MNYGPEVHGKTDTNDVMLTNEVYILYIFAISKRFSYTEYIKYILSAVTIVYARLV